MLTDDEFGTWVGGQVPDQAAVSTWLRGSLLTGAPMLSESVGSTRWLNGYLVYASGDTMVFALGAVSRRSVAFHAMPWYGSAALRSRYGEALAPFVAGKSCFHFSSLEGLPVPAIEGVIASAATYLTALSAR